MPRRRTKPLVTLSRGCSVGWEPDLNEETSEINDIVVHSVALHREGRHRENEQLMRAALRRFPFSPEVLLQAAAAFLLTAPDGTATLARRAAEISPEDPGVLFRAAHLLFAAHEFEASREYLTRAQHLMTPDFPVFVDAIHLAGKQAFHAGDLDEAERALGTAFERAPESSGHGQVLAKLYRARGKPSEAREVVRRARVYRPDDPRLIELERELTRDA